jgi:starch synthase
MRVLMIASEVAPWAKTGGLADVLGALPAALERLGHQVTVVLPRYRSVAMPAADAQAMTVRVGLQTHDVVAHAAPISEQRRVVFIDAPRFFDRDGFYTSGGVDFPDNALRFALLCAAALDFANREQNVCDVIHAHDWQAGLAPTMIRSLPSRWPRLAGAGLAFTIHNLAYQGTFSRDVVPTLGLPWDVFRIDTGEFWGQFGFLKSGITYSDVVTTVSPTYAKETRTRESGVGLDGVLRGLGDRYLGILNGIDTDIWDPSRDPMLPAHFTADDLSGKRACKRALLERVGLPVGDDVLERPLVGLVSRLVEQKGLDLIEAAADALMAQDASWVFVGSGDARHERALRELAIRHPTRVAAHIGFDDGLAHLVEAGADMFLMPSKFEPCGLNQMYSLRYGTVPIVHAVGGLDDTVQPHTSRAQHATGFKFDEATPEALVRTVRQALRLFQDPDAWRRLMRNGMAADHSWQTSAREYVRVYRRARQLAALRKG